MNKIFVLFFLLFFTEQAISGVVVNSSRIIYKINDRDREITISNTSGSPSLVQLWIDDGDTHSNPTTTVSPFIVTPAVFRLNPGQTQSVKILLKKTNQPLLNKAELLYWLNIMDIPPKPDLNSNYLQFAVKSRLKLFLRPEQLSSPDDLASKIKWSIADDKIKIANPTPYFATINIKSIDKKKFNRLIMISPFSSMDVELDKSVINANIVDFDIINDYGGHVKNTTQIKNN